MTNIMNNTAKIIKINNNGGEVNRNEHNKIPEATHMTVQNVHAIDNKIMRLRNQVDGKHVLLITVQARPLHGILQQQEPQHGGLMEPMVALNANHQRILIRKEDLQCISGFSSSS